MPIATLDPCCVQTQSVSSGNHLEMSTIATYWQFSSSNNDIYLHVGSEVIPSIMVPIIL